MTDIQREMNVINNGCRISLGRMRLTPLRAELSRRIEEDLTETHSSGLW